MIAIYTDSQIQDIEWVPAIHWPEPVQIYHSEQAYTAASADYKVAITTHRLHCDWLDADQAAYEGFEEKIIRLSEASDLVFTLESELHDYHWTIWDQCHRPNVYWVQPGLVNDAPEMRANMIYWGDWFKTTTNLYKDPNVAPVMDNFKPYDTKPRYFDALLGSPKPHRDYVAQAVKQHALEDKFILTYGGQWQDDAFYARDYFIWEPGTDVEDQIIGTMNYVRYHGHLCHLSQIIPTAVFNDTAYSIIAETDYDNTLSFFSEKTVKPMIYKRLFIAFTGYKFLANLHSLGFQTFGNVIDESYDLIEDNEQRYAAAFEQVRWLCTQDQQRVFEQIRPALEHNYNLMMNTDWTKFAVAQIQPKIDRLFAGDR